MNYKELISYDDKVNLYSNSNIPAENKVQDTDMNNIKNVVNGVINGTNVMGNVVVDSIRSKNLSTKNNGFTAVSNVIADFKVEKLSAGVTYTVSYYTDKSSQITNWYFKDADKNNVTNIERTNTTTRSSFQITPTTDIYYIGAWANDTTVKIFDFQIEEGSVASTYSPYQNLTGEENYSTNEIRIGTWIDGKPLYRIALESTTYATTYNIPASNVDKITKVSGMIKRSDYNIWQFLPSRLDNANFSAQFGNFQLDANRVVANVSFGTNWSSNMSRIIIIIEYTKTTD